MTTTFQLHALAPDRTLANADVCYEFHTQEDVVRLAWRDDKWKWTRPFETYDEYGAKDATSTPNLNTHIQLRVHPTEFRMFGLPLGKDLALTTLTKAGKFTESKIGSLITYNDTDSSYWLKPNPEKTGAAFCVRVYHRLATRPPQFMFAGHTSWMWVSTALVPWEALFRTPSCLDVETFSWSDVRSDVGVRAFDRILIAPTSLHRSRSHHVEKSELRLNTLIATDVDATALREATLKILDTPAWKSVDALIQITENFIVPENDALKKLRFTGGSEGADNAKSAAQGNLGIPPDGVQFDADVSPRIPGVDWKFYGVSTQSWFDYTTSVVTSDWLLSALRQVQALHGYTTSFADDVQLLKQFKRKMPADTYERLRRRLTDVVRVCTMHSISRPYIPDHVQCPDGSWVLSDVYTSGLALPGDCEDGAHAAYHIYMSILFGGHTDPELKLLRECAAMAGVPMGVLGTTYDPIERKDGEPHCFGIVVPFPTYVCAMFGPERLEDAMIRFRQTFGFNYPANLHNHIKVLETTFFNTAGYEHHTFGPWERVVDEWLLDMGEDLIAWSNMTKLLKNTMSSPFQNFVTRAYTSFNRDFFGSEWIPRLVSGKTATSHTMSFVIWTGTSVGATYRDLFGETPIDFEFRAVVAMSKATYEAERELLSVIRRPVVPLVVLTQDPYKPFEDRHRVYESHADVVTANKPHFVIFVYDLTYVYPDGETTMQKLDSLCGVHPKMKFAIRPFGFSHAAFFHI